MKTLKNKIIVFITGFVICSFAASLHAQTQIGLFTGIDALVLNNQGTASDDCFFYGKGCIEGGAVINTPLIGIKINQRISPKIALTYQSSYAKKKFDFIAYLHGFVYDYHGEAIDFENFMHQLGANYYLNERLYIGGALGLQQYRNIILFYRHEFGDSRTEVFEVQMGNEHQWGGTLRAGYTIRNIDIELSYYHGINSSKIDWTSSNDREYFDTNTSQRIALTIGYMFNFNNKKSKTACPKF